MAQGFAKAQGFEGKAGSHCLLPDADGDLFGVAFGLNGADAKHNDPFLVGKLPTLLPEGVYRFETEAPNPTLATLAWLLGSYSFDRYRKRSEKAVRLVRRRASMPRKCRASRMRSSQAAISSTRRRAISGPTASRRRRARWRSGMAPPSPASSATIC